MCNTPAESLIEQDTKNNWKITLDKKAARKYSDKLVNELYKYRNSDILKARSTMTNALVEVCGSDESLKKRLSNDLELETDMANKIFPFLYAIENELHPSVIAKFLENRTIRLGIWTGFFGYLGAILGLMAGVFSLADPKPWCLIVLPAIISIVLILLRYSLDQKIVWYKQIINHIDIYIEKLKRPDVNI